VIIALHLRGVCATERERERERERELQHSLFIALTVYIDRSWNAVVL